MADAGAVELMRDNTPMARALLKISDDHLLNKDKHSSVGLLRAVNRRKKLLEYLKNTKMDSYKNVLSKLGLRK